MNLFDTEKDTEVEVLDDQDTDKKIVVYNDDFNTFDHVIMCLLRYCDQKIEDAVKLTLQIHNEGAAVVKEGSKKELIPIAQTLNEKGLTAKIEE